MRYLNWNEFDKLMLWDDFGISGIGIGTGEEGLEGDVSIVAGVGWGASCEVYVERWETRSLRSILSFTVQTNNKMTRL